MNKNWGGCFSSLLHNRLRGYKGRSLGSVKRGYLIAKSKVPVYNRNLPVHLSVLMPWLRLITIELLPPRIREAYGLKSTKLRRGAYRLTLEVVRATYPFVPPFIRTYPKEYYLRDMRRRIGNVT
ncbi:hypothetical protein BO71DRAFT_88482 [Aspergillus ellipticus CBS 707.79]|uniref:ER-bound oxygenase mpaB/mpaB'/Rubber oxygenase catalytic domain-containing protein n=1 Tax=Aspergillus ellipticus CBS 707.79 TaxID=1448320 RepID=A0A319DKF2_9EURO|nr:hypothetical protein BO71DRAFT_88482 [Aspergillus ellipticus CBS 707.79]